MIYQVRGIPIYMSERTLLVCPIPREYTLEGSIRGFRSNFPLDFRTMVGDMKPDHTVTEEREKLVLFELGSYMLTDYGDQKICWICVHSGEHNNYQMHAVESIIEAMAEDGLHQEFDMAFPLLGHYEEDGISAYDVALLIKENFGDTDKIIDIHVDY